METEITYAVLLIDGKEYEEINRITFSSKDKYVILMFNEEKEHFKSLNDIDMALVYYDNNDQVLFTRLFKKSKFIEKHSTDLKYYYSFKECMNI